jgi:hypothetical protein
MRAYGTSRGRYFLLCDPSTGIIRRRIRRPPGLDDQQYCCLEVTKEVWRGFKAGETVINRLSGASLERWLANLKRIAALKRRSREMAERDDWRPEDYQ